MISVKIDGQWAGWEEWTQCSVQCGTGVRTSTRECTNPPPQHGGLSCESERARVELCYTDECVNGKCDCETVREHVYWSSVMKRSVLVVSVMETEPGWSSITLMRVSMVSVSRT